MNQNSSHHNSKIPRWRGNPAALPHTHTRMSNTSNKSNGIPPSSSSSSSSVLPQRSNQKKKKKNSPMSGVTPQNCAGCHQTFPSRNALFRHLKESGDQCIKPDEQENFYKHVRSTSKATKVVVLYGYLPYNHGGLASSSSSSSSSSVWNIDNGSDAARILLQTIDRHQLQLDKVAAEVTTTGMDSTDTQSAYSKINRSYGNISRNVDGVAQDNGTAAVTEVMTARLHPLPTGWTMEQWLDAIQNLLDQDFRESCLSTTTTTTTTTETGAAVVTPLRILGRQDMAQSRFNAEMDVSHRRVEYLLPLSFLRQSMISSLIPAFSSEDNETETTPFLDYDTIETTLPAFDENHKNSIQPVPVGENNNSGKLSRPMVHYLYGLKKTMQLLTTKIIHLDRNDNAAVLEKEFHVRKRKQHKAKQQERKLQKKVEQRKRKEEKEGQQRNGIGNKNTDNNDGDNNTNNDMSNHGDHHHHNNNNNMEDTPSIQSNGQGEMQFKEEEKEKIARTKHMIVTSTLTSSSVSPAHQDQEQQQQPEQQQQLHVLKRKRFHNFTPKVMAHEFFAYRRLDRFYHRATLRFPFRPGNSIMESIPTMTTPAATGTGTDAATTITSTSVDSATTTTPFLVLSLTGDMFLMGQVCRVVGLFLAMANGYIDADFCDCVFDEEYPHLVPTPPAPSIGMISSAAFYMQWEGKTKSILTPRASNYYDKGWNQQATLNRVGDWQNCVYREIANKWLVQQQQQHSTMTATATMGRLATEQDWTDNVLQPWAETAKTQLDEYRQWIKTREANIDATVESSQVVAEADAPSLLPSLDSVDASVPEPFAEVARLLRAADQSGLWPSTSLKRQLVISTEGGQQQQSENETGEGVAAGESTTITNTSKKPDSLSVARMKAKYNKEERSSAYSYVEGKGGASGSFSVGAMPDDRNKQPKGNELFPELVKAAFELELYLRPDREPSSTIAINRNAQFRPHTDSGAGAGQSTSLIVGLGTYAGGELVVEGEKQDIRYKALEFNGWTQRHWTMPFVGERYSLVWFTPKGCEGLRGIDLNL
jgi:hypothetical protein